MPTVPLKYVVTFSSQDEKHVVENLLCGDSSKRWLSSAQDKSGQLEAVFQLDRACIITHLDIGTYNTFTVEVLVGQSSWPQGKDFMPLLHAVAFMSPMDARLGKKKNSLRMFKQDDFNSKAKDEYWDRIKIVCSQPFKKGDQFGLSLIKVTGMALDEDKSLPQTPNSTSKHKNKSSPLNTSRSPTTTNRSIQSPSWKLKTQSEIENHFFGNKNKTHQPSHLEEKLHKLGTASGQDTGGNLSRQAKLVMAANKGTPNKDNKCKNTNNKTSKDIPKAYTHQSLQAENTFDGKNSNSLKVGKDNTSSLSLPNKDNTCKNTNNKTSKDIPKAYTHQSLRAENTFNCKNSNNLKVGKEKTSSLSSPIRSKPLDIPSSEILTTDDSDRNTTPCRQKSRPLTFQEEITNFLSAINIHSLDLEKMTFAELRHQLEKEKKRKLTKDERKFFFARAKKFIESIVNSTDCAKSNENNVSATLVTTPNDGGRNINSPGSRGNFTENTSSVPKSKKKKNPKALSVNTDNVWLSKTSGPVVESCSESPPVSPKLLELPQKKGKKRKSSGSNAGSKTKKKKTASEKAPHSPPCIDLIQTENEPDAFHQCPLCNELFPSSIIEGHAANCGDLGHLERRTCETSYITNSLPDCVEQAPCPLCGRTYPLSFLPVHADQCASFSR